MVELLDETNRYPFPEALAGALSRLMVELGAGERELTLILCHDPEIRSFNRRFRHHDEATDVLSFPLSEPDDEGFPTVPHLGDIMISVDTAARQASRHGLDLHGEVLRLAAHGLMHLLGHDHPTEDAWTTFTTAQDRILKLGRPD